MSKETFRDLGADGNRFELRDLRLEISEGYNGEWVDVVKLKDPEVREILVGSLDVSEARRLRDWLNHILPDKS
jgi:hypothetical protein